MTVPSPFAATQTLLLADTPVTDLVVARVYYPELPRDDVADMPRKAIVLSPSGLGPGIGARSRLKLAGVRMDLRSYGETPGEAELVHWAAYEALKRAERSVHNSTLFQSAVVEGGPIHLRDADGDWPLWLGVYGIVTSEVAVA